SLAMAYALRSGQFRQDIPDEIRKLRVAVEQAMRLDPLLAEAHAALGMLHARDARWVEAEKSFRRAIELDPNSSASQTSFAYFLRCLGRVKEALHQLRIVEKNDPLSAGLGGESNCGILITYIKHWQEELVDRLACQDLITQ